MYDICVYNGSMCVCVHIHELRCVHMHATGCMWKPGANLLCWSMPSTLRQDHFVHGSILCTCLGTSRDPSLSTSLTDACLCLALRGFGVFESMCFIHRAISSVPKAALPGHTCFTIKMSGMARSKFLFQYISFPISPEGWADTTGTTLSLP